MLMHHHVETNGIKLHVVEHGQGAPVLLCHGFPSIWSLWRRQMEPLAAAGYRVFAPDMRGYGQSDAPDAAAAYTPFHTVGDLVGLLDHFEIERAAVVGHDFGASIAWNAALMRPDRFLAVFAASVPFRAPGRVSFLDQLRAAGKSDFYMFDQIRPDADRIWADAATMIPGAMYWSSGQAPEGQRWDPFDPVKRLVRPAPEPIDWLDREDLNDWVANFTRTGFHGPLNYYRAIDLFSAAVSGAFAGTRIQQPAFFLTGALDGLNAFTQPDEKAMRERVPDLRGFEVVEGAGHWPQLEAPDAFNASLLGFLSSLPN